MKKRDANTILADSGAAALRDWFDWAPIAGTPESASSPRAAADHLRHIGLEEAPSVIPNSSDSEPVAPARPATRKKHTRPRVVPICAIDLLAKQLPDPRFIVPGYIAEGLTILAGRPKVGKSRLALGIAIAIASGGLALGTVKVDAGSVLYLALEDTERRLQSRIKQVLGEDEVPANLFIATQCPRLDEGAFEQFDKWFYSVPDPRLIIIDVFNKVRPPTLRRDSAYEGDYRAVGPLKAYADLRGIGILVLHHTRKMSAEDPFDTISGTTGFTGAADTALVLAKDRGGVTLYGRGRDVEEISAALEYDRATSRWLALGERSDVRRSEPRKAILALLENFPGQPMTIGEIADRLGERKENVKQLLHKMKQTGEVVLRGKGLYAHPDYLERPDDDYG
jgi:hypothetical protein